MYYHTHTQTHTNTHTNTPGPGTHDELRGSIWFLLIWLRTDLLGLFYCGTRSLLLGY
jgi:hypothetical protein